jgi:hypothetical protein
MRIYIRLEAAPAFCSPRALAIFEDVIWRLLVPLTEPLVLAYKIKGTVA